jgi:O-6-methylguanine DNA methyltransferase
LERVYYAGIETPVGMVWAAKTKKGLVQVHANSERDSFLAELSRSVPGDYIEDPSMFKVLEQKLKEWGAGKPVAFDMPYDLRGTEFQIDVWRAIHAIPYGKLSSYMRLAEAIGRPKAVRAVGNAVGSNPCGLVIPCHRVIWSNGGLGGFGGGFDPERLNNKRRLLMTEGVLSRVEGKPERDMDLTQLFKDK